MKNILFLMALVLLLCGGCKYFKKSTPAAEEALVADTVPSDEMIDSAAYFSEVSNGSASGLSSGRSTPTANALQGKYYMIVGCFTVQNNADKYAEKLRGMGYEAQIISGSNNFQMVSARAYNNYRESVNELDKFRNEVTPNAWVYLQK